MTKHTALQKEPKAMKAPIKQLAVIGVVILGLLGTGTALGTGMALAARAHPASARRLLYRQPPSSPSSLTQGNAFTFTQRRLEL
ncbi:MAG TPA: hypothetical protein VN837_15115, partial [Chloroflexota bacterium]|nr:hypothetical protein [Chloroflexota bacterium]